MSDTKTVRLPVVDKTSSLSLEVRIANQCDTMAGAGFELRAGMRIQSDILLIFRKVKT